MAIFIINQLHTFFLGLPLPLFSFAGSSSCFVFLWLVRAGNDKYDFPHSLHLNSLPAGSFFDRLFLLIGLAKNNINTYRPELEVA